MQKENGQVLRDLIQRKLELSPWTVLKSRVHRVEAWGSQFYMKRDDELSFGISGSKLRKLATLAAYWIKSEKDLILSCGGSYSNHLPALMQAIHETGRDYRLWVLEPNQPHPPQANFALLKLLTEQNKVTWIHRQDWPDVEGMMAEISQRFKEQGRQPMMVKEGALQVEALWGAMSLAVDLCRNEKADDLSFDEVWIDAGTGLSAIGLYLGLWALGRRLKVNVVSMMRETHALIEKLQYFRSLIELECPFLFSSFPSPEIEIHLPVTAQSFGATNQQIFEEIRNSAVQSGILLDPVYTAKLVLTARNVIKSRNTAGLILMIHSGGSWALSGYWQQLIEK